MSTQENNLPKTSHPTIRFLFNCTADLVLTRKFYTELIGLNEKAFNPEWGYLCYQCEGFEFMFFAKTEKGPEPAREWASQPGYEGGSLEITSWAVWIPEIEFAAAVKRLRESGVRLFKDVPDWREESYWGFTAMDPNGVTVEVYTIPQNIPASKEWIDQS